MSRGCFVEDAEEATGVPASTIRRWLSEGRLTERDKHKGRIVVDADEVAELAALLGRHERGA